MIPRFTFQDLVETSLEQCQEVSPTTYTTNYIKKMINEAQRITYAFLEDWTTSKRVATITKQGRQYYHLPPDCDRVETAVCKIDYCQQIAYPMTPIESQFKWDSLNYTPLNTVGYPSYFFIRTREIGIWPIPSQDNGLLTIYYTVTPKDMSADDVTDVTTGFTVSATNDSDQITFTGSFLDESFIGRWIAIDSVMGDGMSYRIIGVINGSTAMLENVYHGSTATTMSFVIGESPDVPPEMIDYLVDYAVGQYFIGLRKDQQEGQRHMNRFWTGDMNNISREKAQAVAGLLGVKKKYDSKTRRAIIYRRSRAYSGTTNTDNIGFPFPLT